MSTEALVVFIVFISLGVLGVYMYSPLGIPTFFLDYQPDPLTYQEDLFTQWSHQYQKSYSSELERQAKFHVWQLNYKYITEFNSNNSYSFTLALNDFADMTLDEFKTAKLGFIYDPSLPKNTVYRSLQDIPKAIDWRDKGAVTPVKNQKMCGSCWAFSATGALEGLNFITNGSLVSFSEQQLVDCSKDYGNHGCGGGLMDWAFNYTMNEGIESEEVYPYIGWPRACNYTKENVVMYNKGWVDVPVNESQQLEAAVARQPVSVGIEADSITFQFYYGGVYDSGICGTSLDHGVLVVGYGTSVWGKDYWIVKNSWGHFWGEKGYIRIARTEGEGPGRCGITKAASYPVMEVGGEGLE